MSKLDMRNTMIELHLISPFHVEPTPDQSNLGRFEKAIRSVTNLQDTRSIYVRPTMITIISNTKFKTSSGLPISLVGLHGKDELLVTGPAWAILKLAQGESVPASEGMRSFEAYENAAHYVIEEIFWLSRLDLMLSKTYDNHLNNPYKENIIDAPNEIKEDKHWLKINQEFSDQKSAIVGREHEFYKDMLQGLFGKSIDIIHEYFLTKNTEEFISLMVNECIEKYKEFLELSDKNYDSHTYWWKGWCNSDTEEKTEISFISSSGRNISKYPLPTEEDISHSKPRRFSMHKRLLSLIAKL